MVLRWIGRVCIALGTLILLFVLYQLYGTGFITKHDQQVLRRRFAIPSVTATVTAGATPSLPAAPELGTGVALLDIPKINLNMVVVQGVTVDDLKKGPGHWEATPLPGERGNVVISGHRTTYLHPFYNVNELVSGDPIMLTDRQGRVFTYLVSQVQVVDPSDVAVANNTEDNRLTLTTCNPRYSASQRMIVTAQLQGPPINPPAPARTPATPTPQPTKTPQPTTPQPTNPARLPQA